MEQTASTRLENVIQDIDRINTGDPNQETWQGKSYPKELLYSHRMTEMAWHFMENPSELIQIAARGQHIKRWAIPRNQYTMDRKGYLQWRTALKHLHAKLLENIMHSHGYSQDAIAQVKSCVVKKQLKTDPMAQSLEDIICLVFLKYYFGQFATKHQEEKVVSILQKTWRKMSENAQKMALALPLKEQDIQLINKALAKKES